MKKTELYSLTAGQLTSAADYLAENTNKPVEPEAEALNTNKT
jgi:hypothetical protein